MRVFWFVFCNFLQFRFTGIILWFYPSPVDDISLLDLRCFLFGRCSYCHLLKAILWEGPGPLPWIIALLIFRIIPHEGQSRQGLEGKGKEGLLLVGNWYDAIASLISNWKQCGDWINPNFYSSRNISNKKIDLKIFWDPIHLVFYKISNLFILQ